jgi:hypothetical protein
MLLISTVCGLKTSSLLTINSMIMLLISVVLLVYDGIISGVLLNN